MPKPKSRALKAVVTAVDQGISINDKIKITKYVIDAYEIGSVEKRQKRSKNYIQRQTKYAISYYKKNHGSTKDA